MSNSDLPDPQEERDAADPSPRRKSARSYISGRPPHRLISDAEILRLYMEEKLDADSISYRAGCSARTVLELVREQGGTVRGRGGRDPAKTLKLAVDVIVERYRNGESGLKLAELAGCDDGTIYRLLHQQGVVPRSARERAIMAKGRQSEPSKPRR